MAVNEEGNLLIDWAPHQTTPALSPEESGLNALSALVDPTDRPRSRGHRAQRHPFEASGTRPFDRRTAGRVQACARSPLRSVPSGGVGGRPLPERFFGKRTLRNQIHRPT